MLAIRVAGCVSLRVTSELSSTEVSVMKIFGWVLSLLLAALFALSSYSKIVPAASTTEQTEKVLFAPDLMRSIGMIEIVIVIIYLLPQTSVLGAILLTGYMGGAIVVHLQMGESFLFQFLIGVMIWFGCAFRQPEIFRLVWGGIFPFFTKSTPADKP